MSASSYSTSSMSNVSARYGDIDCLHKKCGYFTAKISANEWVGACSHTQ